MKFAMKIISEVVVAGRVAVVHLIMLTLIGVAFSGCAAGPYASAPEIDAETHAKALSILRKGMHGDEFWPSMHAAEGLTLGGYGDEVKAYLEPKLPRQRDDQKRCGLAREMVRAGDTGKAQVMLDILAGDDDYGHVHAAESLYKVGLIGDGVAMRKAFAQTENMKLHLMAAAALAKQGDRAAMHAIREGMLANDNDTVRISAWLLGRIGNGADRRLLRTSMARVTAAPETFEPVVVVMIQNSLAALGDPAGKAALMQNLESVDDAFRTYSATFAGDANLTNLTPKLIEMLDDPYEDARIRAAQTLLVFSRR